MCICVFSCLSEIVAVDHVVVVIVDDVCDIVVCGVAVLSVMLFMMVLL